MSKLSHDDLGEEIRQKVLLEEFCKASLVVFTSTSTHAVEA